MACIGVIAGEASLLLPSLEIGGEKRGWVGFRGNKGVSFRENSCSSVKLKLPTMVLSNPRLRSGFFGKNGDGLPRREAIGLSVKSQLVQGSPATRRAQKWWGKGLQHNMKDVTSAQDLVDSLSNVDDKLMVVGFFSLGCGGCRALHPKLCQLAEQNPNAQFLLVNYEEHKSMCYSLNVHVLPFFRFYRGAHGRLCSFSCTNATIKKFRDALAKHTPDWCSLGPTKGLEEKELLALAANKGLSFKRPIQLPANRVSMGSTKSQSDFPHRIPSRTSETHRKHEEKEKTLVSPER